MGSDPPGIANLSDATRGGGGGRAFLGLIASHCFLSLASARHSRPRFFSSRPPTETARTAQPGSGSSDESSRVQSELCPRKHNSTSRHMMELSKLLRPATLSIRTRETCSSARCSMAAGWAGQRRPVVLSSVAISWVLRPPVCSPSSPPMLPFAGPSRPLTSSFPGLCPHHQYTYWHLPLPLSWTGVWTIARPSFTRRRGSVLNETVLCQPRYCTSHGSRDSAT